MVIGNDRYVYKLLFKRNFDLVAYPFVDKINLSFVNSDLNAVLKAIDIEESKSNLYIWLQILELIANSCYSSDDNSKQILVCQRYCICFKTIRESMQLFAVHHQDINSILQVKDFWMKS